MTTTSAEVRTGAPVGGGSTNRHLTIALLVISIAQLMVILDGTIVNVALPDIGKAMKLNGTSLTWVVTAYTLAFGGLLMLGGRLGDILGRRRIFISGVALFAAASLLGGFAQSSWWLLAARGVQGVGGALMAPTALSLITTNFPAGKERNRAMAVYAAMSGAGAAIGLILGGLLTSYLSWRWVLFVNVPIGLFCVLAARVSLVESDKQPGRFDLAGAISATGGIMLLVYGLTHAAPGQDGHNHWGEAATIVPLIAAVVLLVFFFVNEARSRHALMPMRVLADRNRGGAYLTSLAIGTAMLGIFFFLSIFVQNVWGYSPVKTGVAFLPVSAGIVISAGISSQLVAKLGALRLMIPGTLLTAGGMFWLSFITESGPYWSALLLPMLVTAIGLGFVFMPLTLVAVHGVDHEEAGVASGLLNTGQQVGGSIGLALLSTVVFTSVTNYFPTAVPKAMAALHIAVPAGQTLGNGAAGHALPKAVQSAAYNLALTHGIQLGFEVAAGVALLAAVITAISIRVKRDELQGAGGPMAV